MADDQAREQAIRACRYFERVLVDDEKAVIAVRRGEAVFVAAIGEWADRVQAAVEALVGGEGDAQWHVKFDRPPS